MATKTITVSILVRHLDTECPDCMFDAMIRVHTYQLLETGVKTWMDKTYCGRCAAEGKRDGRE